MNTSKLVRLKLFSFYFTCIWTKKKNVDLWPVLTKDEGNFLEPPFVPRFSSPIILKESSGFLNLLNQKRKLRFTFLRCLTYFQHYNQMKKGKAVRNQRKFQKLAILTLCASIKSTFVHCLLPSPVTHSSFMVSPNLLTSSYLLAYDPCPQ